MQILFIVYNSFFLGCTHWHARHFFWFNESWQHTYTLTQHTWSMASNGFHSSGEREREREREINIIILFPFDINQNIIKNLLRKPLQHFVSFLSGGHSIGPFPRHQWVSCSELFQLLAQLVFHWVYSGPRTAGGLTKRDVSVDLTVIYAVWRWFCLLSAWKRDRSKDIYTIFFVIISEKNSSLSEILFGFDAFWQDSLLVQ